MAKKIFYLLSTVLLVISGFIFLKFKCSASGEVSVPGGEVHNKDELIEALGGSSNVLDKEDYVLLCTDIKLENPVIFLEGEYVLSGGGCRITSSFDDNSFFIVGDGEKKASLKLGSVDAQSDNDSIIFDGDKKSFDGSFVMVKNSAVFEIYKGIIFKDAVSKICGSAVYNEGTFTMYSGKIENCRSDGSGGALFNKGDMILAAGSIRDCSSELGGGAVYNEGKLEMTGTEINACRSKKGGAIFNTGSLNYRSSSSADCSALDLGGGIYNSGEAEFFWGQLINCKADKSGGGIYNTGSAVFSGTYLEGNSAVSGGNIYNCASTEIKDGQIYSGFASENGGNVYNDINASLFVSGGSVSRGRAVYGGGIFNIGKLTVSGGGFNGNKADIGAAILNDGKLYFKDYPYVDGKNDVAIVIDSSNSHAAEILSEMKAETVAVFTPVVKSDNVYSVQYVSNAVLITGEYADKSYVKFKVTSDGSTEWFLSKKGTFYKKLPIYCEPLFYIILLAVFAALVFAIVFAVRFYDIKIKKKATD